MTTEEHKALQNAREQRQHEMRIALINAFAKDPELKYYAGVAVGAGVSTIAALLTPKEDDAGGSGAGAGDSGGTYVGATIFGLGARVKVDWDWLLPAAVAVSPGGAATNVGIAGLASWLTGTDEGKAQLAEMGWPQTIGGIISLGSAGFAGWCGSILLLKAISGEKGIGALTSLLPEVV